MNEKRLYKQAVRRFGIKNQLAQLSEECNELAVSASHVRRGRISATDKKMIVEIADVKIMLNQIIQHYDLNPYIDVIMPKRLKRLEDKIKGDVK